MRLALVILLAVGCSNPTPVAPAGASVSGTVSESGTAATPEETGPRVIFPDGFVVKVEIAANDELRARGLMFRDRLDADRGMLFLFPGESVLSFWMKNYRIPLDMIFMDSSRRIVGISENVPPCKFDPCPSYGPGVASRYVLEVGGGVARQHGLKTGDVLTFEKTSDIPVL